MKRKFRVTVGDKTFIVEVEEISEKSTKPSMPTPSAPPTPLTQPAPSAVPVAPLKPVKKRAPPPAPMGAVEGGIVVAPLAGTIKSIRVRENDRVEAGDVVLILEAMKMENEIYAPKSGVVKKVAVAEDQTVDYGHVLITID